MPARPDLLSQDYSQPLYDLLAKAYPDHGGPRPWQVDEWAAYLANPHIIFLGFVDKDSAPAKPALKAALVIQKLDNEAEIITIATAPDARRHGLASALLAEFLASHKEISIFLEVSAHNHNAIGLYKKYGFKQTGRRKAYYQDGSDGLIMVRKT